VEEDDERELGRVVGPAGHVFDIVESGEGSALVREGRTWSDFFARLAPREGQ
jgi:hypothetical protein